jgi:hypothetical protein
LLNRSLMLLVAGDRKERELFPKGGPLHAIIAPLYLELRHLLFRASNSLDLLLIQQYCMHRFENRN